MFLLDALAPVVIVIKVHVIKALQEMTVVVPATVDIAFKVFATRNPKEMVEVALVMVENAIRVIAVYKQATLVIVAKSSSNRNLRICTAKHFIQITKTNCLFFPM